MTTVYCTKGHDNHDSNRFCQICGEKLDPPVTQNNLAAGNVLEDRYRIVQQIGQGGFGRTYLCENLTRFNEPCVLKEFAPQVQGTYALEKAKKLFEREASVLHNLTHPQIPRFRELFQMKSGNQGLFLVQDYVAGQTYRYLLAARQMQDKLFSEAEVRQLMIDTLPVLEYIHSLGVIHRDIAPDNLMLRSSDNLPVLIDFGGVKQIAVSAEIHATGNTEVPTCLGKVGYAPHEQMQRGTVSANSDLYALAATSLVLLTGKEPTELIDPQSLSWNWRSVINLDPQFGALLDRMLQPNPSARFQSASEVLQVLKQTRLPPAPVVAQSLPVNSTPGTVVVAPAPQRAAVAAPALAGEDSSFLQILGRSWLGILGLGAVGAVAWAGSSMLNKQSAPPIAPINSVPVQTPTSTPTPTSEPTPSNSEKPIVTPGNNTSNGNLDKPSSEKTPATQSSSGTGTQGSGTTIDNGSSKPANNNNTDSSAGSDRPRRNSTNTTINPPRRNNPSTEEEPAPKPPKVEIYETKPRPPRAEPDQPKPKPPRVEVYETPPKPRQPRAEPEEPKPRPARVEIYETPPKPRKRPESANSGSEKPVREPKRPAKQPASDGGNDDGPLF
jgi:serine/threonine protein kinase